MKKKWKNPWHLGDTEDGTDTVNTADGAVEGCFDGVLLMSHRAYEHHPVFVKVERKNQS